MILILGIIAFVVLSFEINEDIKPILWLSLDDIQVNRIEVEMVRGETFLPKEKIAMVKDEMNGQESEILGKYYESVSGVINDAVLLDGISY